MPHGSVVIKDGVKVIEGTPAAPLERSTLFLKLWRVKGPHGASRTLAALAMARPTRAGYVIKDLLADMELPPKQALEKAVAIARRGEVAEIYINADLKRLPKMTLAAS